jgi:hypothetical protein
MVKMSSVKEPFCSGNKESLIENQRKVRTQRTVIILKLSWNYSYEYLLVFTTPDHLTTCTRNVTYAANTRSLNKEKIIVSS